MIIPARSYYTYIHILAYLQPPTTTAGWLADLATVCLSICPALAKTTTTTTYQMMKWRKELAWPLHQTPTYPSLQMYICIASWTNEVFSLILYTDLSVFCWVLRQLDGKEISGPTRNTKWRETEICKLNWEPFFNLLTNGGTHGGLMGFF